MPWGNVLLPSVAVTSGSVDSVAADVSDPSTASLISAGVSVTSSLTTLTSSPSCDAAVPSSDLYLSCNEGNRHLCRKADARNGAEETDTNERDVVDNELKAVDEATGEESARSAARRSIYLISSH